MIGRRRDVGFLVVLFAAFFFGAAFLAGFRGFFIPRC
jgi:hypothetical protein